MKMNRTLVALSIAMFVVNGANANALLVNEPSKGVVIGDQDNGNVVIGAVAKPTDTNTRFATALGSESFATELSSAVGRHAIAGGKSAVAVGSGSSANAENSVALGTRAGGGYCDTKGQTTVDGCTKVGVNSTSLGASSHAFAAGSVALGSFSIVRQVDVLPTEGQYGVVSVGKSGSNGFNRRVINVADGVNDNDAVNVGQIKKLWDKMNDTFMNKNGITAPSQGGGAGGVQPTPEQQAQAQQNREQFGSNLGVSSLDDLSLDESGSASEPSENTQRKRGRRSANYAALAPKEVPTVKPDPGAQLVQARAVLKETRIATNGNYILKNTSVAKNLTILDNQVKHNADTIDYLDHKLTKTTKELKAGIAGATAMAMMPTSQLAGKGMLSASVGGYNGQNAVAVGYSRNSENNRYSFKAGVSLNTQKDINYGAGVGMYF